MNAGNDSAPSPQPLTALILTMGLFAIWGFGQRLYDGLLPQFAGIFGLRGVQLAIGPGLATAVYFAGAIPAALCARSFGYKGSILLGLGVFSVGAFLTFPATQSRSFQLFLWAVAVMACGWILLEVAVNALVVGFGNSSTAVQRLNFAHALYVPGALLGMVVTRWILAANSGASTADLIHSFMRPYVVLGVELLLISFLIESVRFPSLATDHAESGRSGGREIRTVFAMPLIWFCTAAEAFSMVGQTGLWYLCQKILGSSLGNVTPVKYLDGLILLIAIMAIGRLVGTALMFRFRAERLLAAFSAGAMALTTVAACVNGPVRAVLLLAASFCLAINWPTAIGLGIRDLGPLTKLGVAPICMGGIAGGFASVMLVQTVLVDSPSLIAVMTVFSLAVVVWFAHWYERRNQPASIRMPQPLSASG